LLPTIGDRCGGDREVTTTGSFGEVERGVFPALLTETFADPTTQPFWDAAKEDRLVVPRCGACGTFRLPPAPLCYVCQSEQVDWVELTGVGTVYSYTVVRHALHPELADVVPYVSGIVELDGTQGVGSRLLVNIIDCEPDAIHIGTRVKIVFDHLNEELSVVRFRPLADNES
jgi:uncharacterized OB-fold protein